MITKTEKRTRINLFRMIRCPICDKEIVRASFVNYAYALRVKNKLQYYCSYTCFRVDEKKMLEISSKSNRKAEL
jgi:phage FluMu protein Com